MYTVIARRRIQLQATFNIDGCVSHMRDQFWDIFFSQKDYWLFTESLVA